MWWDGMGGLVYICCHSNRNSPNKRTLLHFLKHSRCHAEIASQTLHHFFLCTNSYLVQLLESWLLEADFLLNALERESTMAKEHNEMLLSLITSPMVHLSIGKKDLINKQGNLAAVKEGDVNRLLFGSHTF